MTRDLVYVILCAWNCSFGQFKGRLVHLRRYFAKTLVKCTSACLRWSWRVAERGESKFLRGPRFPANLNCALQVFTCLGEGGQARDSMRWQSWTSSRQLKSKTTSSLISFYICRILFQTYCVSLTKLHIIRLGLSLVRAPCSIARLCPWASSKLVRKKLYTFKKGSWHLRDKLP